MSGAVLDDNVAVPLAAPSVNERTADVLKNVVGVNFQIVQHDRDDAGAQGDGPLALSASPPSVAPGAVAMLNMLACMGMASGSSKRKNDS